MFHFSVTTFLLFVKPFVYGFERIESLELLREKILNILAAIPARMVQKVTNEEVPKRMLACIQAAEGLLKTSYDKKKTDVTLIL